MVNAKIFPQLKVYKILNAILNAIFLKDIIRKLSNNLKKLGLLHAKFTRELQLFTRG